MSDTDLNVQLRIQANLDEARAALQNAQKDLQAFKKAGDDGATGGKAVADAADQASQSMGGLTKQLAGVSYGLAHGVMPNFRQLTMLSSAAGVALSAVAAVVGTLVAAHLQGERQAKQYAQAIANTGNVAGVTTGQLAKTAADIGKVTGSQAEAAKVLSQMVASGKIAPQQLAQFTTTAIKAQKDLGQSTDDTIKILTELGGAPVEASAKYNEALHYLTLAQYDNIKALVDRGSKEEAAKAAQQAFADAVNKRADDVAKSVGTMEKAWNSLMGVVNGVWAAMKGVGAERAPEENLAAQQKLVDQLEKIKGSKNANAFSYYGVSTDGELETAKATLKVYQDQVDAGKAKAQAAADATRREAEGIAGREKLNSLLDAGLTKQEKLNKGYKALDKAVAAVRADGGTVTDAQIAKARQGVKNDVLGDQSGAALRDANAQSQLAIAQLKANLSLIQDEVKNSDAIVQQALKDGTTSIDDAYQVRLDNLVKNAAAQRAELQAEKAEVDQALKKAKTAAEKSPLLQRKVQIDASLKLLDSSLKESERQLSVWKTEQEKQLATITAKVKVDVSQLTGQFDRQAVEQQLKLQRQDDYAAAGRLSTPAEQQAERERVDLLVQAGVEQAAFNDQLSKAQSLQSQLQVTEAAINAERDRGNISQIEADAQIEQARTQAVPQLQAIIDKMKEMRDAMPPNAKAAIDAMSVSIGQLQNTVTATAPVVFDAGKKIKTTFEDSFGGWIATAITDTKNLRSTIANTLKSLANDIISSGVKEAFKSIFNVSGGSSGGGVLGLLGGLFGGGSGGGSSGRLGFGLDEIFASLADGGMVSGPGSATSDSIPARLSNGEFVQPARAVAHYGAPFMEALRTLQFPRPRFAFGGLVQASQRARFATGGLVSAGAGAAQAAPNVVIQITNTGTPQRVTQQSSQTQGRDAVVRIVLDDYRNGGPISRVAKRS